ncbi:D-alanyl-D-alanine carboxypeptidase [Lactiplantibacillus songbeiensis]|uniref:D-alanyl-D-alanine carboxypeptidase n=1 Tax=Lactiplantibacillus songbeiensis TaxID=2559920 RepID=A0ABW4C0D4_9LACO|nr:D-alanyl-D-alanine carboxypeptidase [Lactiplantibacillus songbeiensis]
MKKLGTFLLLGALVGIGGLSTVSTPAKAQIKTNFTNITDQNDFYYNKFTNIAYHPKSSKKNAYIWNDTHTKKLYNLKSYPNYTWFKVASGTYKGSHNWVQVTNSPDSKRGWVYKSNLTKGYNSKGYQITSKRYGKYSGGYYHVPAGKKNIYLWDWTHTKKRLNIKSYTNQTFSRRHSVIMTHNGSKHWYYYVGIQTKKQTVYGYVRSDQVKVGKTTDHSGQDVLFPGAFVGTKDYVQYINQGKYQKLAREIVKLFPNTPVDLGLSRIAAYNYATNDTWEEDAPETIETTGYKDIVPFESVATYLMAHKTQTNAQKIAGIEKLLNKAGYTKAKRAKLSGYKLGIYIINNVKGGKVTESGELLKGNWYGLVIGKTE